MPTSSDIAGMTSLGVLSVRVSGQAEQAYLAQHGTTIGRAKYNAIVIDHCDLCPLHARICKSSDDEFLRVVCEHEDFALSLPNGQDLPEIVLANGVEFLIGEVRFSFCELPARLQIESPPQHASPLPAIPILSPMRVMCPRCHEMLLRIPVSAKFCPRCGLDLPEHCPPWSHDGEFDAMNTAVLAYANALFNLGLRFESVPGGWDLEQARRYFQKAAKFGITPAKARLEGQ